MIQALSVNPPAGDSACQVVRRWPRTLAGGRAHARSVERGESAAGGAREAVHHIARVEKLPRDRAQQIDRESGGLNGASIAWNIERREVAAASAHEPVSHAARVHEVSRDRALRVNARADGNSGGAGRVEHRNFPSRLTHEAVNNATRIGIVSGDCALQVKARFLANEGKNRTDKHLLRQRKTPRLSPPD